MSAALAPASERRIPSLDGVRAIAVIGVIASHSGLFGLGWVGVDIFFGLSGYLITGILLDAKVPGVSARSYFGAFYMRRALRILPIAWLVLVLVCWVRGQWDGFLWYLGYLVNWLGYTPAPRDLGHYWSLAVEEQFYLFWPAVVYYASRRALLRFTVAMLVLDALCRLAVSLLPPEFTTPQFRDLASFARADTLLVGALLAQRERSGGFGKEARWAFEIAVAAALVLVGIRLMERADALPVLTYNLKWPVIATGVWAGLLVVLTRSPRFLQWGWVVWIGKVSYGVYIIHALFGGWLHERFTLREAPVIFALQLAFTLPLAAASWYLFESRILRLKRYWPMPGADREAQRQPTAGE